MKKINVGLNGFGRIGRAIARIGLDSDHFALRAINTSSTTPEQLAYTLKYDSVYRTLPHDVQAVEEGISVNGELIKSYNIRNPEEIPWNDHDIDVVIDCTGVFKDREKLSHHLTGAVKKVILTAPTADETIPHVVLGVNDKEFDWEGSDIISNASCTTNCAAVMAHVLAEEFGIESGHLTTAHSYTNSQSLVDNKAKKFTRGRAAAVSIIPTTTGASDAVCKVTDLAQQQLGGVAIRVPTPVGSLTDMVCVLGRDTSVEEIHSVFKNRAEGDLKDILGYEETPLVSSDYIGNPNSCTFDANYTHVLNGNHVKIFGWYDNEWGYSNRIVDLVARLSDFV